jgi:hypothetical protein
MDIAWEADMKLAIVCLSEEGSRLVGSSNVRISWKSKSICRQLPNRPPCLREGEHN